MRQSHSSVLNITRSIRMSILGRTVILNDRVKAPGTGLHVSALNRDASTQEVTYICMLLKRNWVHTRDTLQKSSSDKSDTFEILQSLGNNWTTTFASTVVPECATFLYILAHITFKWIWFIRSFQSYQQFSAVCSLKVSVLRPVPTDQWCSCRAVMPPTRHQNTLENYFSAVNKF
jgi:hypothetical protein